MGLSNAERQKRWRQKQKEKNLQAYRQRERERKRKSYIPHNLLPAKELEKERMKDRIKARRKYQRQKQRASNSELPSTSSERVTRSRTDNLIVKLPPLPDKKTSQQKRYKTALRAANRRIAMLTARNQELIKSKRKLQKRNERILKQRQGDESPKSDLQNENNATPRSKTKLLLKKAGVNIRSGSKVHRQLLLGNAVIESLKERFGTYKKRDTAEKKMALTIIRKYRCTNILSKHLGVSRRKISMLHRSRVSKSIKEKYGKTVVAFLEREDNSVVQPGKRDTKTVGKDIHQKRVLNDYLHNLFSKFRIENPEIQMSRSEFSKLRPPYILLTCFASRRTCLCTYHQNFSLKLKAIRNKGIKCSPNPDTFLKEFDTDKMVKDALDQQLDSKETITYKHWKRVNQGDKYRWKEIEENVTKQEFIALVEGELSAFRNHVKRVQNQYSEMRRLRENLPDNEILMWMDFAENYGCASMEEVQSAYWNSDMVSLHTMVIYSNKQVESYVAVSDVLTHNATSVYSILQKIVPILKEKFTGLKKIHYLTDSPTSQYRNKTIFQVICHHSHDFGVSARWNYLEVGHGKGPCDGLGASVKRSADMAVKQGKCSIQNASEFFSWANTNFASKVKYILYDSSDIKAAEEALNNKETPQAVPGTLNTHAVVPISETEIAIRELSCCCPDCLSDVRVTQCSGWTVKSLTKKSQIAENESRIPESAENEITTVIPVEQVSTVPVERQIDIKKNDWVAAVYENKWYIGQVTDNDNETKEVQINFLTASGCGKVRNMYKFPNFRDEIWLKVSDVLLVVESLESCGKSKRCYKLAETEKQKIEALFDERN